ncbi:Dehydrogenase/reductase SDR family member 12 [Mycena venus]|uniref:Dehydrogenase/reductase SDR family member 12 n=1 Tax=Mycena venus TaxID=2733690 RepID=A0A8H6WSF0_9AGAR|nr:Dehydrogenase/reductase SDR family member 12 [Mycena venus]
MGTLALERVARENPRLSVVHWFPGPVATPGLARAQRFGISPASPMSQDEAGRGGLVPVPQGLEVAKSGGGIFLIDPQGESTDNEGVLAGMRKRGVDEAVWRFTQKVFSDCTAQFGTSGDEL